MNGETKHNQLSMNPGENEYEPAFSLATDSIFTFELTSLVPYKVRQNDVLIYGKMNIGLCCTVSTFSEDGKYKKQRV